MKLNKHTLENGLRIVHKQDDSTQMVTMNILYNVGSKHECEDKTGFAHLFEHLMFGGSKNIPDYDTPLQLAGGNNNAYTTSDFTDYYLTVPVANIETVFWLESDRMNSLAFTPQSLEVQRKVVMEEFKQRYLTPPYGDISHLMSALSYKKHHYMWPTIGKELEHIANAKMSDVKDFFYRFYAPNNAVLSIVGNISMEEVRHLAEKWFGPVPRRIIDCTPLPQEPEQTEQRRMTVERDVPANVLYISFPIPGMMQEGFHCCDMISDILSVGKSCRLNKHLVEERHIFTSLDAYIQPRVDTGLLYICGMPAESVNMSEAEAAVWEEIDALNENGIAESELEKVKNKYETTKATEMLNRQKLAENLSFYETLGNASWYADELKKYRSISKEQFMGVCRQTLKRERSNVLWYLKKNN